MAWGEAGTRTGGRRAEVGGAPGQLAERTYFWASLNAGDVDGTR